MLNYLNEKKAEYESNIAKDKELIKECENTICECMERIKADNEKLAFIGELIANAPAPVSDEAPDAEAEEEEAEEEKPADSPVVIQYSKKV